MLAEMAPMSWGRGEMVFHDVSDNLMQPRPPRENALCPLVGQVLVVLLAEVVGDHVEVAVLDAASDS